MHSYIHTYIFPYSAMGIDRQGTVARLQRNATVYKYPV